MSPHLPNHLRAHRKRLALSQDDVSFLLGVRSGAKACRYERFLRQPGLETALAYVAIFQKQIHDLFPGLYEQIRQRVVMRARILCRKVENSPSDPNSVRKQQAFM